MHRINSNLTTELSALLKYFIQLLMTPFTQAITKNPATAGPYVQSKVLRSSVP